MLNKPRNVIRWSLFLIPLTLAYLCAQTNSDSTTPVRKQGVGYWESSGTIAGFAALQPSWGYDWGIEPKVKLPANVEFVPMIWNMATVNAGDLAKAKQNGTILLGFNEPDHPQQANMKVEQALDAWPQLEATGMRLGSPAVASGYDNPNGWLAKFMAGAATQGYRVDFICVHDYQGAYDAPEKQANALCTKLERIHQLYQKPLWLTEFALANWHNPASEEQQAAYAKILIPRLEKMPFLERYAWFALPPDPQGDSGALAHSNLCTKSGDLTSLGLAYKDGTSANGAP